MSFKFEELKVWQRALDFSVKIHELTLYFPKDELYVLTSQIKRAADSIVLNIAEGSTGQTNPEFNKFLSYALRSGIEVVACLHIAKKRNLIADANFTVLYSELEIIIKMIQALRKTINS
ncbi:four helix bundle protein [Adhaeribacter radiodurans]|uniref:Four helix bundle protein n=1 Tax=Adhaeribacter radiodurans TaxID=2745197 RepID=A0A7L7LEI1_9BACT|nr:four helix bundle protein [Adhaeribacter radiodurans]QMU31272.1 four helix bundle protein [Adhaeribacter radiodurans]